MEDPDAWIRLSAKSNFIPLRDTPAEQKPEPKAQEPIVLPAIDAQSHWVTEVAPVWVAAGEPK